MSYKHKIVFGAFHDVEKQLDELRPKRVLVDPQDGKTAKYHLNVLEDVSPLGIAFVPAMIQGSKQQTMIPFCAVLTLQWVEDPKPDEPVQS